MEHHSPDLNRSLKEALSALPLIAVLRWITPEEVEDVTAILVEAEFGLIEVPLNSPDPFNSIERIAHRFGSQAIVGAGTVMAPSDVTRVRNAGGRLIVMPHADIAVVKAAHEQKLASFPGVSTPTEGFAALQAGADGLKVFPAEAISPAVLKAWRAVFSSDVPLLPTGGITPGAFPAWLAAGASGFGIGGNLYRPGRSLTEIKDRAKTFADAWRAATSPSGGS